MAGGVPTWRMDAANRFIVGTPHRYFKKNAAGAAVGGRSLLPFELPFQIAQGQPQGGGPTVWAIAAAVNFVFAGQKGGDLPGGQRIASPPAAGQQGRTQRTRRTVDLSAATHRALDIWQREAADRLGVARVTGQEVLTALIDQLLVDPKLTAQITRAIKDRR